MSYDGRYRPESTRLRTWDYSDPGWYFVTICTNKRVPYFGRVNGDQVELSPIGQIVAEELLRTAQVRPTVSLDVWRLMPDHLHLILVIEQSAPSSQTPQRGVSTTGNARWKPDTLGSIINQFKAACTNRIRKAGYTDFAWQARFYDHIIRNEIALDEIRHYIRYNPSKLAW